MRTENDQPRHLRSRRTSMPAGAPTPAGRALPSFLPGALAYAVWLALGGAGLSIAAPCAAQAQAVAPEQAARRHYDIPAGALAPALRNLASTANLLLTFTAEQTEGKTTAGIQGRYTAQEALAALLAHSGLQALRLDNGAYVLRASAAAQPAPTAADGNAATLPTIKVTAQLATGSGDLPKPYAGGQVARGGQLGLLGNKDIMDAPFSQTSYTRQTIDDQQARSLGDVLANEPSVMTGSKSGGGIEFTQYRGFMTQTYSASNSLNGLPGMAPMQFASTDYIERVEVLRGASAMLRGASMARQGALGGSVNLVTKQAGDTPLTQLDLRYMSDAQFGAHVDLGRRFGPDGAFGIRFNGSADGGDPPVDTQHSKFRTAALNLDYRGERVRLSADAAYQLSDLDAAPAALKFRNDVLATMKAVPRAPDNRVPPSPPWAHARHEIKLAMVQGEVDLSDRVTAYAAAGAQRYQSEGNVDSLTLASSAGAVTMQTKDYRDRTEVRSLQAGLRAMAATGPVSHTLSLNLSRLQLTFGTNPNGCRACGGAGPLINVGTLYDPVFPATALSIDPGVFADASRVVGSSIAVADTMSALDDRVQFIAGVRRQRVKSEGFSAKSLTATADTTVWSPSFALVVKPWQRVSLYGNYIENLEPGLAVSSGWSNYGEVFPPLRSKQYETGAKVDWGKVVTTVALFQITQPGTITIPSATNGLPPKLALDGEQRNRGIELNAFGEPVKGVRLLGGFTYLDAIRTKTQNGTYNGATATGSPKYRAVIGGEWETPFVPRLTLSGRFTYTSSSVVAATRPDLSVPSWTQVDVGARYSLVGPWKNKPITLRFNVDNLFDQRYWKVMFTGANLWRSDPRTFRLSATLDF